MVFKALTQSLIAAGISAIPWHEAFALIRESACRSGPRGKAISAGIRPLTWPDSVTFANDWLSFTSHHNHRQTFPAFTKILLESRLAFVQRASRGAAPYARARSTHPASSLTLGCHEHGWVSQLGLELHRRKMFSCRANGGYGHCVSLVDLKHVPVEGKQRSSSFSRQPNFECLTYSPSIC
jgi:hypothetical protein